MKYFNDKNMNQPNILNVCWLLIIISVLYGVHLRITTISTTEVYAPIRADAYQYYHYAKNIAESSVYSHQVPNEKSALEPDALRSPGFPFFASLFMTNDIKLTLKKTLWWQTLIQIFCFGLASVAMVSLLGIYWGVPSIFLLWTFPHFISINSYYLSESLFTSFLALNIFLVWKITKDNNTKVRNIIICGLLLGVTALIRPIIEYFPIYLLVLTFLVKPKLLKKSLIFAVSAFIPIILWKIRNLIAIDSFSDPTLMINALYHGSFPEMMYNNDPSTVGFAYKFDPDRHKVYEGLGITISIIWQKIVNSPIEYLNWYLFGKQKFLWRWSILAGQGDIFIYPIISSPFLYLPDMKALKEFHYLIHDLWIILALVTSFIIVIMNSFKKFEIHNFWVLLSLFIIYIVLIHIVIAPYPRYGIPFKLYLLPLCIFGAKSILEVSRGLWKR